MNDLLAHANKCQEVVNTMQAYFPGCTAQGRRLFVDEDDWACSVDIGLIIVSVYIHGDAAKDTQVSIYVGDTVWYSKDFLYNTTQLVIALDDVHRVLHSICDDIDKAIGVH
jgi:hypothetical protein